MISGSVHFHARWYSGAVPFVSAKGTESRPGENKLDFPPDPVAYHTFAVCGCIWDVSVSADCLMNELAEAIRLKVDVRHLHRLWCSRHCWTV